MLIIIRLRCIYLEFKFSERWSWVDLETHLSGNLLDKLEEIKNLISIEDANYVCNLIMKLEKPEDIRINGLIPRYAFCVIRFTGSPEIHGLRHGISPFSSKLTIRSVIIS